jgi:ubiquinone/menaquinone biosynthesis C-methylase UbiE
VSGDELERFDEAYDLDAGTSEHYQDAALYDFEYRRRRRDVTFYREIVRERPGGGGAGAVAVLELGCGCGRVMAPLARDGHGVVGLDLSTTMLARAAARLAKLAPRARARATLVRGDFRALPFAAGITPLVICPFNGFQHLYTRTEAEACLAEVRRVLTPGGAFVFDVLNPDLSWLTRSATRRWARTRFRHPTTGETLIYSTNQTYEPISQIAYMRIYYESGDRTRVVRLCHRQFFPAELEGICTSAGFRIAERFGGFNREPLVGDSESQVLLCIAR